MVLGFRSRLAAAALLLGYGRSGGSPSGKTVEVDWPADLSAEDAAARTLKGYSLNHGRLNTRTDAMRHFNPIPVNGNFELTRDTP